MGAPLHAFFAAAAAAAAATGGGGGGRVSAAWLPPSALVGTWATVSPWTRIVEPYEHGISHPSVRYSHAAATWRDQMVITHGYQYNELVEGGRADWLTDTWSFGLDSHDHSAPSRGWVMLSDGQDGRAPNGRYGHSVAVVGDTMYMFGGDDGSHALDSRDYRPAPKDELWLFDLEEHSWSQQTPTLGNGGSSEWPPARSLHAAGRVGDDDSAPAQLVVYGGRGGGNGATVLDDTWSFDTLKKKWRSYTAPPAGSSVPHPGRRSGAAAAADRQRLYVFGGTVDNGLAPVDDMWAFTLSTGEPGVSILESVHID
jgi:hypothetical protein